MSVNDINYLEILKDSWKLTWKNRFLWWFGLLIALTSFGGNFNFLSDSEDQKKIEKALDLNLDSFFSTYFPWIIAAATILFLLFIVFLVLGIIARGGLIGSVNKIIKGETTSFKAGFQEGKKYFWRLFLISVVLGIFILVSVIVLIIPIAILFASKSFIAGILLTIIGILMIIPIIILISFLKTFGYLYAVLGDLKFWPAIESAYALFRANIWSSIIMALFFIPIGLVIMFGTVILLIPAIILFLLLGFLLYAIMSGAGIIVTVVLAILVFLVVLLFAKSVLEVFYQSVWVMFFRQIADAKIAEMETVETLEEIKKEELLPKGEVVKTAEIDQEG